MKFIGSKKRIAKELISVMLKNIKDTNIHFYDVCCGGGNVIEQVNFKNRTAIDINPYIIETLKAIRDFPHLLPKNSKEFTEEDYLEIKNNKDKYPKWLVGYVGYVLSYRGLWFKSYARPHYEKKRKRYRDYVKEAYNSALKQSKKIQNVKFICTSYNEISYKKNSIIYIDPPYKNVITYEYNLNHNELWEWVRKMSINGYKIYVSEQTAPNDFIPIWNKPIINNLSKKKFIYEKLFIFKKQL